MFAKEVSGREHTPHTPHTQVFWGLRAVGRTTCVCVPAYRGGVGQLGVGEVAEYVNGQLGRHMAQGVTQRAPLACIICPHQAKPIRFRFSDFSKGCRGLISSVLGAQ
jgi:hypothetical protein